MKLFYNDAISRTILRRPAMATGRQATIFGTCLLPAGKNILLPEPFAFYISSVRLFAAPDKSFMFGSGTGKKALHSRYFHI